MKYLNLNTIKKKHIKCCTHGVNTLALLGTFKARPARHGFFWNSFLFCSSVTISKWKPSQHKITYPNFGLYLSYVHYEHNALNLWLIICQVKRQESVGILASRHHDASLCQMGLLAIYCVLKASNKLLILFLEHTNSKTTIKTALASISRGHKVVSEK